MFFVLFAMVGRAEMSASFIGTARKSMVDIRYNIFWLNEGGGLGKCGKSG